VPSIEEGMQFLREGKVDQAVETLERAAHLANPEIFALLGKLMEVDEYGIRDCTRSISYYELGIKHGDRKVSPVRLGRLYLTGECVERDLYEAVRLFQVAANEGETLAFLGLGMALTLSAKNKEEFQRGRGAYFQALVRGNLLSIGLIGESYQREGAVIRGLLIRSMGTVISIPCVMIMPHSEMVKSL